MEFWIPITIVAAFSQNVRSALQKHLTDRLSTVGATQARFLYALPLSILYVWILCFVMGYILPTPNSRFFVYATIGAIAQIVGTALLVAIFSYRNFFVGTAFSKTEAIQTAILGFFILSDDLSLGATIGICLGVVGVVVIAAAKNRPSLGEILKALKSKSALIGIFAGLFFGIAAISFRGASLSLGGGFVIQAAYTLAFVLILQTLVVSLYLSSREPGQMSSVLSNWRVSWPVGLASMIASVGWFTAMTLQNAGYVRALGQIELVFAFLTSVIIFKETTAKLEFFGTMTIVTGILILLLYR